MEPLNNQKNDMGNTPSNNSQTPPMGNNTPSRPIISVDEKEGSVGPIIASIIIIILIIIGGLYFWGSILREKGYSPQDYADPSEDQKVKDLNDQEESDSMGSIEADANATNIDDLDDGLDDIDGIFEEA